MVQPSQVNPIPGYTTYTLDQNRLNPTLLNLLYNTLRSLLARIIINRNIASLLCKLDADQLPKTTNNNVNALAHGLPTKICRP